MKNITVKSSEDQFIISVDKDSINKESLLQFIDNLSLEPLAEKVYFDEDIDELSEWNKEKLAAEK